MKNTTPHLLKSLFQELNSKNQISVRILFPLQNSYENIVLHFWGKAQINHLRLRLRLLRKRVLIWWSRKRHCITSARKQWRKKFTDRILLIDQYWVLFRFKGRLTACCWHPFLRIIAASKMWGDEFYFYIRQWHSSRKRSLQLQTIKTTSEIN